MTTAKCQAGLVTLFLITPSLLDIPIPRHVVVVLVLSTMQVAFLSPSPREINTLKHYMLSRGLLIQILQ